MSALGGLAVVAGLIVVIGGRIACAVTGDRAGMILVIIVGLSPLLWARRGGRDALGRT